MLRDSLCHMCGTTFRGGATARYCSACRAVRKRQENDLHQQRVRHGEVRRLGTLDRCQRCGDLYTIVGPLQKYCKTCAPISYRERAKESTHDWWLRAREQRNAARRAARQERSPQICPECGKEFRRIVKGGALYCSPACGRAVKYRAAAEVKRRKRAEYRAVTPKKRTGRPPKASPG